MPFSSFVLRILVYHMRISFFFLFLYLLISFTSKAQALVELDSTEFDIFGEQDDGFSLIEETPLTLNMEKEMELSKEAKDARKVREKRRKRKVFYGLKTKKGFTRRGVGDRVELEIFHYLKEPIETDPYVPEIWWYDFKRKGIRSSGKMDPKNGVILHGPYKKIVGEQVRAEGIYFKGTRHGRWTYYDGNDVLIDKRKYYKGWQKESVVRYYDEKQKKLKEVVPFLYGKRDGIYYYFHENGTVAIRGEYKEGVKVGKWTEYYDFRRRKKEIQYPSSPYDESYQPFISKEWDRRNRLVYEAKF